MSNFWDILHCMDLLMSEYSIPEPSQELFLEWGVIEVQMTHMSQPLMTQQWLSSSNGWGHPQRVRNGQKPCEEKAAATAGGAKLIQLILGQESPFPPSLPLGSGDSPFQVLSEVIDLFCHERSCHNITRTNKLLRAWCLCTPNHWALLCHSWSLSHVSDNGGLLICFSRGWCRTIIGCDRLQGDAVGELNNFITILFGKHTKITSALGGTYVSRMKQNFSPFNQKFSEKFTRCLIGMGYNLKGFFLAHWFEPRFLRKPAGRLGVVSPCERSEN